MARLSTFEANPHYWPDNIDTDRLDAAKAEANEYFRAATRLYKLDFDTTMLDIAPYAYSPRWERDRAKARARYLAEVKPFADMLPQVEADIYADGEMSEATQTAWNAIGIAKLRAAADECDRLNVRWDWSALERGALIPLAMTADLTLAHTSAERGA